MLVGTHVRLRVVDTNDIEYMRQLRNAPETIHEFQSRHFISDAAQIEFYETVTKSGDAIYFIAEHAPSHAPFGVYFCRNIDHRNQRCENGVFLDPARQNAGIEAFEAAYLLLMYEFEYLNFQKICAEVLSDNIRAVRFNHGLGMKEEGMRKQHVFYDGAFHDIVIMCLFRDDFYAHPTPAMQLFHSKCK